MRLAGKTFTIAVLFLVVLNAALFIFYLNKGEAKQNQMPELQELSGKNLSFAELSSYFTNVADLKGAEYAFQVLGAADLPPNVDLHLLGHIVGDKLYRQEGVDGIKKCTQEFRNACSHSIVVGLFSERGEEALFDIAQACRLAPGGPGAYTMCFHGLGHGILAFYGYDLKKAVEICGKTEGSSPGFGGEAAECVGGTIMEIIGGGGHDQATWARQRTKYLTTSDILSPCNQSYMPVYSKGLCYSYLTPHLFEVAGADLARPTEENFKKAFPYCDLVPAGDKENRTACYSGFGKEFVVLAPLRDIRRVDEMTNDELSKIVKWCKLAGNKEGSEACQSSALASLYWGGENKPNASIAFCSLIEETGGRQLCFNNLIENVFRFKSDRKYLQEFCGRLSGQFMESCSEKLR